MRIDHIAIYVHDLDGAIEFFGTYFDAKVDATYHNPTTGLRTRFLSLDGGARIELMNRPGILDRPSDTMTHGYTHLAFSLGSEDAVDALAAKLADAGYEVLSGPRVTGDGYYEASIAGFEGINIEITV